MRCWAGEGLSREGGALGSRGRKAACCGCSWVAQGKQGKQGEGVELAREEEAAEAAVRWCW